MTPHGKLTLLRASHPVGALRLSICMRRLSGPFVDTGFGLGPDPLHPGRLRPTKVDQAMSAAPGGCRCWRDRRVRSHLPANTPAVQDRTYRARNSPKTTPASTLLLKGIQKSRNTGTTATTSHSRRKGKAYATSNPTATATMYQKARLRNA